MYRLSIVLKYVRDIIFLYLFFSLFSIVSQIRNLKIDNLRDFIKEYIYYLYHYTSDLLHGNFGNYYMGNRIRVISEDISIYAWNSFKLLFISLFIGMVLSIFIGVLLTVYKKKGKISNGILMFLNSIPDFILVLFLQLIVISLNKTIGFKLINIASSGNEEALLLPIISMTIIPMVYLIKEVISDTSIIITEEYMRTAVSKGLTRIIIIKHHVLSNLIPIVKTDLIKILSISIGNLFIVEYLFNIRGLTSFMFNWNQYVVWISGFILLAVMFLTIYYILSITLIVFRRLIVGE